MKVKHLAVLMLATIDALVTAFILITGFEQAPGFYTNEIISLGVYPDWILLAVLSSKIVIVWLGGYVLKDGGKEE